MFFPLLVTHHPSMDTYDQALTGAFDAVRESDRIGVRCRDAEEYVAAKTSSEAAGNHGPTATK
jgi:hypothetical protein